MKLKDKVAIVTGGASGIGEAIAHKFAHEGATVLIADLPDSAAKDVSLAIIANGGKASFYLGDLSEERHAEACVNAAVSEFGSLDILASNAGVFVQLGEIDTWTVEAYDYLYA